MPERAMAIGLYEFIRRHVGDNSHANVKLVANTMQVDDVDLRVVMYVAGAKNAVAALDAATGTKRRSGSLLLGGFRPGNLLKGLS